MSDVLVREARKLLCRYHPDGCDLPKNIKLQDAGDMTPCDPCRVRRLADIVAKEKKP